MAYSYVWYETESPKEVIDLICKDIRKYDSNFQISKIRGNDKFSKKVRNSKHVWIPSSYWVSGFLWHYILLANRTNFLYDIECIDGEHCQYTEYGTGCFYNWHVDSSISDSYIPKHVRSLDRNIHEDVQMIKGECVRKLTFVMQLSDPGDYDGGDLQFLDHNGNMYSAPREKGSIIIFDSRLSHRVKRVKSGTRRSLVGWVVGPRWK